MKDVQENHDMLGQFPSTPRVPYHSGLGDEEPVAEPVYGHPRIVWRKLNTPDTTRDSAVAAAKACGIEYEYCYLASRYWCFVVYE